MSAYLRLVVLGLPICTLGFRYTSDRARWSLPKDITDQAGLSRKLRFAVHPDFCRKLRPRFALSIRAGIFGGESTLCRCEEIQEALIRAFNAWTFNTRRIGFFNISQLCDASQLVNDSCGETAEGDPLADVFISAVDAQSDAEEDQIANTTLSFHEHNFPVDTSSYAHTIRESRSIKHAHIRFMVSENKCYYLDDKECRSMMLRDVDAMAILLAFYVLCNVLGFGMLIFRGIRLWGGLWLKGKEYAHKVLIVHLSHFYVTWAIGILIIFPNALLFGLYGQCLLCHSFEAVAVHQVGRALGMETLVENSTMLTVSQGVTLNSTTCQDPDIPKSFPTSTWSEDCSDPDKFWTCKHRDFSVMLPPKPSHTRPCLSNDDLAGLNWLYPSCNGTNSKPICVRSDRNHFYINFLLMAAVPLIIMELGSYIGLLLARRRQKQRLAKMRTKEICINLFGGKAIFDKTDAEKKRKKQERALAMQQKINLLQFEAPKLMAGNSFAPKLTKPPKSSWLRKSLFSSQAASGPRKSTPAPTPAPAPAPAPATSSHAGRIAFRGSTPGGGSRKQSLLLNLLLDPKDQDIHDPLKQPQKSSKSVSPVRGSIPPTVAE